MWWCIEDNAQKHSSVIYGPNCIRHKQYINCSHLTERLWLLFMSLGNYAKWNQVQSCDHVIPAPADMCIIFHPQSWIQGFYRLTCEQNMTNLLHTELLSFLVFVTHWEFPASCRYWIILRTSVTAEVQIRAIQHAFHGWWSVSFEHVLCFSTLLRMKKAYLSSSQ